MLFWDVLFCDVPGVFISPYQRNISIHELTYLKESPLDFGSEYFLSARRQRVEQRFDDIRENKYEDIIKEIDSLERSNNTICVGINWDKLSLDDILSIANVRTCSISSFN